MTLELIQGSREWELARVGKVTGSRVHDATWKLKNGTWSAARNNYMAEIVTERLSGVPYPHYRSGEMQWGIDNEPLARDEYALICDEPVEQVGFVKHPTILMAGASPDGLVGPGGMVQFKCPNTSTHIRTLLGGPIDIEYMKQMQWEMGCTGRKWNDFVSFDPRVPPEIRMFVKRVWRSDQMIAELEKIVIDFLIEVESEVAALCDKYNMRVAA